MNKPLKIALFILCLIALVFLFIICYVSYDNLMEEEIKEPRISGVLGDYNWEIRNSSGRIDVDKLVTQLKNASVNTYAFLIWHRDTDYDDLKIFLPVAERAGIDVWVYLVSPSECPPYSEPYKTDYITWARELANLSLQYPNLKAFAIDDFSHKLDFFSQSYVSRMMDAAHEINPKIAFLPVIYYYEIRHGLADAYGPYIDGIIFPYRDWPNRNVVNTSSEMFQIEGLKEILTGKSERAYSGNYSYKMSYPWGSRSNRGTYAQISQNITISDSDEYIISFWVRDSFIDKTSGYHFKQLLIDGNVVWEEDVAGDEYGWLYVEENITPHLKGRERADVILRVYDKKRFSAFGISVWFDNITLKGGIIRNPDFESFSYWNYSENGALWSGTYDKSKDYNYDIPLIVMIYVGDPCGTVLGQPFPTLEYIESAMTIAHDAIMNGTADGVMTYCLYKGNESSNSNYYDRYLLIQKLYNEWSNPTF